MSVPDEAVIVRLFASIKNGFGRGEINVPAQRASNLERLLAILCDTPERRRVIFQNSGAVRPEIQMLVNGRNARFMEGLQTTLSGGDEVSIFPPMYGG